MSDISNYLHGQITRKKIEKGLEMLRNESPQELKKRLQNVNIDEAMRKLDEYDKKRLRELGINVSEYRKGSPRPISRKSTRSWAATVTRLSGKYVKY